MYPSGVALEEDFKCSTKYRRVCMQNTLEREIFPPRSFQFHFSLVYFFLIIAKSCIFSVLIFLYFSVMMYLSSGVLSNHHTKAFFLSLFSFLLFIIVAKKVTFQTSPGLDTI